MALEGNEEGRTGSGSLSIVYQNHSKEVKSFIRSMDRDRRWIMIAIEGGRFRYRIGDVAGEAAAGDVVFCPPDTEFRREIISPLTFHYAKFTVRDEDFDMLEQAVLFLRNDLQYKFAATERDRLSHNFRYLSRLHPLSDPEASRLKLHFIKDIWIMFYIEAASPAGFSRTAADPVMIAAKELIERNAYGDVRMGDIAERLNIRPVQLTRKFRNAFGMSPSRYLIAMRMEKAKAMLMETNATIERIATQCGYENGFYFSRMFTKYAKVTPSHYRTIHQVHSP